MIPFSPPRVDQLVIDAVAEVLRSGWITTGPRTRHFESQLNQYCGSKATLCLNSATSGLELMLRWYGVKKGDEVIVPAYTYAATSNVVLHCGAQPVFVDVNADDFNISVTAVEKAVTPRTKVIMPVDFGGYPCDYDALNALVKRDDIRKQFKASTPEQEKLGRILVLSDAAHSIGAVYKGRKAGCLADVNVFSFHAVKNLTTAEGGAVALNLPTPFDNEAIYKQLSIKALHGQNKDALAKTQGGSWKYDIVEAGYKYNMTDIQAAIGLVELGRYTETLAKRRQIILKYSELLGKHKWAQLPVAESNERSSSFHLYPLRIKGVTEEKRDEIIREITARKVSVNVHFIPVPMMSHYRSLGYDMASYPVAYDNYSREISLPVFFSLGLDEVAEVVKAVEQAYEAVMSRAHA